MRAQAPAKTQQKMDTHRKRKKKKKKKKKTERRKETEKKTNDHMKRKSHKERETDFATEKATVNRLSPPSPQSNSFVRFSSSVIQQRRLAGATLFPLP